MNLAALSLEGGEDEAWKLHPNEGVIATYTGLCLVGSFLTATIV